MDGGRIGPGMEDGAMRRMATLAAMAGMLAGMGGSAAAAQTVAEAHAQLRAIGKVWSLDVAKKDMAIYKPLLAAAPKDGVTVTHDVSYGPDARNKLDVFQPTAAGKGRPMVAFFYGGGLVGGDKVYPGSDDLVYANVGTFFARNGMIGVNANYRLVPHVTFPGGGKDVAGVVAWMRANAARLGGDPDAIFLMGNSAGGTHVATYVYDRDIQPADGPEIAGAIFLSGAMTLDKSGRRAKVTEEYLGPDKTKWSALEPLGLARSYQGKTVPTLILTAEFDPQGIEQSDVELLDLLCKKDNGCPAFMQIPNHNHLSTALSLNTDDASYAPRLLDFIRSTVAHRPGD
jgi:triacylglycerol lipase